MRVSGKRKINDFWIYTNGNPPASVDVSFIPHAITIKSNE